MLIAAVNELLNIDFHLLFNIVYTDTLFRQVSVPHIQFLLLVF